VSSKNNEFHFQDKAGGVGEIGQPTYSKA
jgi:hypothetical protein